RSPPPSTLFPYTTLFRSAQVGVVEQAAIGPTADEGVIAHEKPPLGSCGAAASALLQSFDAAVARIGIEVGWRGAVRAGRKVGIRSEEHTSELQSRFDLVC